MSANSGIEPTKNEMRQDDPRAEWERPALRRLAVHKAEAGIACGNDGVGGGGCPQNMNHPIT
jgi:hypothetical protein